MEELDALCKRSPLTIILSSHWEHLNNAKEVLASHGYVQVEADSENDTDEDEISFAKILPQAAPKTKMSYKQNEEEKITFPEEVPKPQYGKARAERSSLSWKPCESLQLDTSKHDPLTERLRIQAQIPTVPKIVKPQTVGIQLLMQPFVKLDECQFYVKLRIDKFIVGTLPSDSLSEKQSLGFYPSFVKLTIEPELEQSESESQSDLGNGLASIMVYLQRGTEDEDARILGSPTCLSHEVHTSSTTVGGQIGYGPASLSVQQTWGREREVNPRDKVKLVPIDALENGNLASFEWSIVRWNNGARYKFDRPHSGIRLVESPRLPLQGTAAKVEGIPDVMWRLPRKFKDSKLKLKIRMQVQMHLVWFLGNMFFRALGFDAQSFQYQHVWSLKHPSI